jgi:Ala-tRNA(Pro) deacylase
MEDQKEKVLKTLENLGIGCTLYHHPPAPTIEEAQKYWKDIEAAHCKNIFFRNHKGNRHYLVIIEHKANLAIHDLEKCLKQGKLSFASEKRMKKYLGLSPGSVSPFGLINDTENHVHVFLDINLKNAKTISFHPNLNTYSVVISFDDFIKFMNWTGNSYEFLELYD